ncbi:DUF3810 domain-containing protein [Danxiaibacter flavus]|uniref:DUF3810 domain-containing protein n=1 Tax=Danxiaibacter flavus TaxID=3049108 RepID=A0ABV3ZJQ0_9BACT|nr:DUF3810 domain-containing protein [Chitinophagaceae bacterium DXS]
MEIKAGYKWIKTGILIFIVVLIRIFSVFGDSVERYYSTGFFPWFAPKLRVIQSHIPFSLGDILYALVAIWLIKSLFWLIIALIRFRKEKAALADSIRIGVNRLLWLYIIFNVFWGLNYDRLGIAYQLKIDPREYDVPELQRLTADLLTKVNSCRRQIDSQKLAYPSNENIFHGTVEAYQSVQASFPFLRYDHPSIKSSLYGKLGNYMGFLGYYNPFTAESQVNVTPPRFVLPYVTCHEVAHQLGYGSESEANFVGYLVAARSKDVRFNYSVYFDLFSYANNELFMRDSVAARANYKQLDTLVKLDIKEYRKFFKQYRNPIEPFIKVFYSNYLKANNQPKGIDSYNEVVGWLIAYRKKYGVI